MRIHSISIKGFKICNEITFEPGRVNVFIGSNGSGKSTLLEAIGLISAAMTERVNNDIMQRKGIRLSSNDLYQSRFKKIKSLPAIYFEIDLDDNEACPFKYTVGLNVSRDKDTWRYSNEHINCGNHVWANCRSDKDYSEYENIIGVLKQKNFKYIDKIVPSIREFADFSIYQPNTPAMRATWIDPSLLEPVGLHGRRLAEAIEEILAEGSYENFGPIPIDDVLRLIEWAEEIRIQAPTDTIINSAVPSSRRVIEFQDKYMQETRRFTAYDASEGALYVLFLLVLAVHKDAPNIFAVDNFDQAMNPLLSKAATEMFCSLILNCKKTVFLTTHNPLALDGLDLQNDDIRLFVMGRNRDGSAAIERITINQELIEKGQPLSRLWANGWLGGIPNVF